MLVVMMRRNFIDLPVNISLSYFWCGGFAIGCFLIIQFLSGVVLSFLYVADTSLSFFCVFNLTQDSFASWVIRYTHIWGVSTIFSLIFLHMGRSLYYSSYSKTGVWNVGFLLYILMMIEAFLGYILPWHQMSYWAATVITSIVQSIPLIGNVLYVYIVGGFGITNSTLIRVFSAHICLAFVILAFSFLHLYYLHLNGSNNPLIIIETYSDVLLFHSYFTFKDFFFLLCVFDVVCLFIVFDPDFFLDSESFIEANCLLTPSSIKPEWYFLSYYAILRSVDSKLGGMFLTVLFLFLIWLPTLNLSSSHCCVRQIIFWLFAGFFVLLTYLGSCHPEYPFLAVSKVVTFFIVVLLISFKGFWLLSSFTYHGTQGLFFASKF